jgi:hypothetical protein
LNRDNGRQIDYWRIHLAVRKNGDGTLMLGLAGVRMQSLVQRRRRGQQIQQENNENGQDPEGNPAMLHQTGIAKPQSDGNLAGEMPIASSSLNRPVRTRRIVKILH